MSELELMPLNLDLEGELLEHLAVPESVMTLYRSRFKPDLIYADDPTSRLILRTFKFTMDYVRKYHEAPTVEVLQAEISEIEFERPTLPIDYLIEAFRKRYNENEVLTALENMAQKAVEDPGTVARAAVTEFQRIMRVVEDRRTEIDLQDADWVIDEYVAKQARGDMVGYTFGWHQIDSVIGGIRKGGLYFVIGRPKRYKSWFLLKSAVEAAKDGVRVCFFSLEMGMIDMFERAVCMFAGTPWSQFTNGQLSDSHIQVMRQQMELYAPDGNFHVLHPPIGQRDVNSILRMAEDREADVVYIDQLKFIESTRANRNDARWQQVEYVCEDLKEASHTVPFYVACQFNREAANMNEMADLAKIGLSDSIGQTADMLLGLYMNKEMKESRPQRVEFGTIESRSFEHARWLIPVQLTKNSNFGQPERRMEEV